MVIAAVGSSAAASCRLIGSGSGPAVVANPFSHAPKVRDG
jgi:hypothetical protein